MSKHDPDVVLRQILSHAQEAANRVPENVQTKHPQLPWQQMIGARNRLIHGYDSVDFDILWAIIKNDLPDLILRLQEILQEG